MSGKVNPFERNSDKCLKGKEVKKVQCKSATFTGKGEKSESGSSKSRFKVAGRPSEQHYESEFLVTMRIVVARKYKAI